MNATQYLCISEFGDIHLVDGEIPIEILRAVEDGIYYAIDISNPKHPMQYSIDGWIAIENLPNHIGDNEL